MIPIAKPVLEEAEAEAARQAVLSGWVTQGPEVADFEREFAAFVGAPHAAAEGVEAAARTRLTEATPVDCAERSLVIARYASATARIRPPSGIASPAA